jgi:NAD(P) transhydrogenase subunit alpha
LTLLQQAQGNTTMLAIGALSLGFALYNVIGGFLVTDRMLAMFRRKGNR